MSQVLRSFNMFLDSNNVNSSDKSDDLVYSLAKSPINCGDGQVIRLTLQSFNMYRNWYMVNQYNNQLVLKKTGLQDQTVTISPKNYASVGDIATNLGNNLSTAFKDLASLNSNSITFQSITVLPQNTSISGTSDKIIDITLTYSGQHTFTGQEVSLQCIGDSAELLGAKANEFEVSFPNSSSVKFRGIYPAQRSTEENIYVRTDLPCYNMESATLSSSRHTHSEDVVDSNILAKVPIDFEFAHIDSKHGDEYFIETQSKHISQIRIQLRDSKDRALPIISGQNNNTGNHKFSMVIRVDIMQKYILHMLESKHPVSGIAPTKLSRVNFMDAV